MNIEIREKRTGKIKSFPEKYAKILVGTGYGEYITKEQIPSKSIKDEIEDEGDDLPEELPKRRGRKPKNTYETKVLTAEE